MLVPDLSIRGAFRPELYSGVQPRMSFAGVQLLANLAQEYNSRASTLAGGFPRLDDSGDGPEGVVYRLGIGEDFGDILVEFDDVGSLAVAFGVLSANATGEIVLVELVRVFGLFFRFRHTFFFRPESRTSRR